MNKLYIYVAVAVLLVGGGVGAYFITSNQTQAPEISEIQTEQADPAETPQSSDKKSLKDLIALGTSQTCTFTTEGNGGVVMVSSGKMRGDFTSYSSTDATTQSTHMIVDGQTSYIWIDGQKSGFQMTFDPTTQVPDSAAESKIRVEGQVNTDEKVDANCAPWVEDPSVFSLPAGVTFTDFSSMIPNVDTSVEVDSFMGIE